jgi:ribulose-bisphosphate carboxylase large chain
MNIKNRPLVGCIVKPKVGLTPKQYGKVVYNVWSNGIDVIKDDENLTSLKFNKFEDRVREVMKVKKIVEKETGEKKMYVFNVTAPFDLMLKRAKFVKKHGGKCVMIDVVSVGMDNVQLLRKQELKLIIHGHRAGHSAFTRNDEHGMTMYLLAKLARLAGIDQLHTGTVVGKMDGDEDDVIRIDEFLKEDWAGFDILEEDWSSIKPTMPIASGGLHPGLTTELMEILGNNVIINYGGGLHGHPDGSAAGARACRQSIDATLKNISLVEYAKTHEELSKALKKWENK